MAGIGTLSFWLLTPVSTLIGFPIRSEIEVSFNLKLTVVLVLIKRALEAWDRFIPTERFLPLHLLNCFVSVFSWWSYFRVFSTLIMNNEHLHRLAGFKHSTTKCRRLLNRLMWCKRSRSGEDRAALWLRLRNNWHHNRVWKCGRWVRNLIDLDQALVRFHYLAKPQS